jgi:hypothetical protein
LPYSYSADTQVLQVLEWAEEKKGIKARGKIDSIEYVQIVIFIN